MKVRRQFRGKVANFNIFSVNHSKSVGDISSSPCKYVGDIVSQNSTWDEVGMVKEEDEEEWKICNSNRTYTVAISARMNWNKARTLCGKLGGGNITEVKNERENDQVMSLFDDMRSTCKRVWTPLRDKEEEGKYKSYVSGKHASYLPWNIDQPNGGTKQNHIAVRVTTRTYHDENIKSIFVLHVMFTKLQYSHS